MFPRFVYSIGRMSLVQLLSQRIHCQNSRRLVLRDGRFLLQDVAELVHAFEQAMFRELVDREIDRESRPADVAFAAARSTVTVAVRIRRSRLNSFLCASRGNDDRQ